MTTVTHGREQAVRFGTGQSLVGVLTDAASTAHSAGRPGVLFLNSGIIHRVGTCRLHVRLARALSVLGFPSLRFDFSGIGDSDQRRDALTFEESAIVETREAMDYLARRKGVNRFILIGLCSGADMAHETAVVDDRVAGLMLLDAWAWRTLGHRLHHYAPRLLDGRVWRNAVRIRWQMLRGTYVDPRACITAVADGVEYEMPTYVRVFPPRDRVARDLQAFVERRIHMYFLWTGGLAEYNHEGQYRATFPQVRFGDLLREEHLKESTHIVSGLEHQQVVVQRVSAWAMQHFSGTPPMAECPTPSESDVPPPVAYSGRAPSPVPELPDAPEAAVRP
jgi:hypothetical protein